MKTWLTIVRSEKSSIANCHGFQLTGKLCVYRQLTFWSSWLEKGWEGSYPISSWALKLAAKEYTPFHTFMIKCKEARGGWVLVGRWSASSSWGGLKLGIGRCSHVEQCNAWQWSLVSGQQLKVQ